MNNSSPPTLGDYIYVKHGFAFKGEYFTDEKTSDVLITPGNFAIGGGFQGDKLKFYAGPVPDEYVLRAGDLVLTMTDLSKSGDTLGYPALIPQSSGFRYLLNQRIGLVEIQEGVEAHKRFLFYRMCADDYRHHILATASGSTVRHTSPSRICDFETCLPKIDEQRALAGVLGALDDKIEQNGRTSAALEGLTRSMFRAWFVDFEPVKAKAAGATSFPSMPQGVFDALPAAFNDSPLGPIPQGWEVGRLGDNSAINGCSVRKGEIAGQIEYVDIASVSVGRLDAVQSVDFSEAPSRARRCIAHGDTIWSCVRPNRRSYLFIHSPPMNRIVSTGFAVLSPGRFGASYLYEMTTRPEFVDYLVANADGSAYPAVRADHFAAAEVLVPPAELLAAFEDNTMPLRDFVAAADAESRNLAELRDYLLPKLLSGQVRVRDAQAALIN